MSDSGNAELIDLESTIKGAHALVRRGRGVDACRLLAKAADRAISINALDEAAVLSNIRGSYLVALGRDDEALQAYQKAEELSPENFQFTLATARHLIFGMKRPADALNKAAAILEKATGGSVEKHEARVVRGLAFLHLDQPSAAINELDAICREIPESQPSISRDLTLVELLLKNNLGAETARRYLTIVEKKAHQEQEVEVLKRAKDLHKIIPIQP